MTLPFSCVYQGSPAIIQAPQPATPTVSGSGGSIATGTVVNFAVSARVGTTESLATVSPTVTTAANSSTATVTWPLIAGASDYRIYASTGAGTLALVGTSTNGSYTWTGSAGSGAVPSVSGFTEQVLYTVPAGKTALLLGIVGSNPTTYTGRAFLSRVPSGGSAQRIVAGTPVPPDNYGGQPLDLSRKHALAAGDQITGYVDVPGVILTLDALVG